MEGTGDLGTGPQVRPASQQSLHFEGLSLHFFLGVFLFRVPFGTVWQPHWARSFLLHVFRRRECGREDAPFDPLFSVKLKASMPGNTPLFGASWSAALVCISSLVCRRPCLATRQFVVFLFVSMRPQQSPESSIWPHIGTTSVRVHGACNAVCFVSLCDVHDLARTPLQRRASSPSSCSSAQRQLCTCRIHVWAAS